MSRRPDRLRRAALGLLLVVWPGVAGAQPLQPCRVSGLEHEVQCGRVVRPLDPARPLGPTIEVHYVVVPATARRRHADPVVLLAGGPGQSAIDTAPTVMGLFARLNNRRDIVFVDQRGTGRSAPLQCDGERPLPLVEQVDPDAQVRRLEECRTRLVGLPHVPAPDDLRFFTTTLAMQDLDAVRAQLGVTQWNLVGASYGTRAALEYMRQFPQAVRRAVLDGVVPPDMVLPAAASPDAQAAFDALLAACADEPGCRRAFPDLRRDWEGFIAALPRTVNVVHPVTGRSETFTLTREMALGAVRGPLYLPALAAGLPAAIAAAARGRYEPLLGLASQGRAGRANRVAVGMHFAVTCAEDVPRLADARDAPGPIFGDGFARLYRRACASWPRAEVPQAFYAVPPFPRQVLLLSGGADPATPPRHGERVARALGPAARHVVAPQAGHGLLGLACVRDVLFRFVDAADDSAAAAVDADCVRGVPRPPAFVPPAAASGATP